MKDSSTVEAAEKLKESSSIFGHHHCAPRSSTREIKVHSFVSEQLVSTESDDDQMREK